VRLRRPLEAAQDYAEVVQQMPDDFTTRLNYARALARGGRRALALDQLEAAAAAAPGNPGIARLRKHIGSRGVAAP
jgi:predicted Zn-dependent protease